MSSTRARIGSVHPWLRLGVFAAVVLVAGILLRLASWVGFLLLILSVALGIWAIVGGFRKTSGDSARKRQVIRGFAILIIASVAFLILAPLGTSIGEAISPLSAEEVAAREAQAAQREAEAEAEAEAQAEAEAKAEAEA